MIIQVIGKAAAVLELLGDSEALSFSEIWRGTGLNKTTVAHLLQTLQEVGYAEKTSDGRYRLGPALVSLARKRLRRAVLRELAEHEALALAGELRCTVTVAALEGGRRHKLAKASGDGRPALDASSEQRVDLYATATGRVLLAFAAEPDKALALEQYGLPRERWPEARAGLELETELERIRREGRATVTAEDSVTEAVAVPVVGPDGKVWAAIGYAGIGERGVRVAALSRSAQRLADSLRLRLGEGRPAAPAEA